MNSAMSLFSRMTEVEKIKVRGATSSSRLEYLGTTFKSDLPDLSFDEVAAVMQEVKDLCDFEFKHKSAFKGFGLTWKF